MREKENDNGRRLRIVFFSISLILFLFFLLPFFHNMANSLPINLHFCDHSLCMIYSLIWLFLSVLSYHSVKKENFNENGEKRILKRRIVKWIILFGFVLIIGIILMNIIPCNENDEAKIGFISGDGGGSKEGYEAGIKNEKLREVNETYNFTPIHERGCSGYHSINRTCKDFTIEWGYDYWKEPKNCSECWNIAVEKCGGSPSKLEDCISPEMVGDGGEIIRCGNCCVWSCYEEISCGDYASENGFENWIILEKDDICEEVAEKECDYHIERYFIKNTDCCVWNCGEKEIDNETNCEDGIDNDNDGLIDCDDSDCECEAIQECQDSDGGINGNLPGECNNGTVHNDYCLDENNLMEFYCNNLTCEGIQWQCKNNCTETSEGGRCY